ncbi:GNAT family N-acetyltransferase [Actinoplanes sp. G11-F43]|uniref:GNAT family N-acetyltransferase n=1 Tax=Actinoplanes sp. G11-F43 TaxID=3424130 RepID=UPI003D337477
MEDLERDGYVLSADPKRVDFTRVHRWLAEESYWAAGRSYDLVARSIDGSVPYSVFAPTPPAAVASSPAAVASRPAASALLQTSAPLTDSPVPPSGEQVAFARAVTDGATFAWICDVFVDQHHRGHGLGKWMIDTILADLSERGIQRFLLATRDAHDVYRRSGFTELAGTHRFMEIDRRPTRESVLGNS